MIYTSIERGDFGELKNTCFKIRWGDLFAEDI